MSGPGGPAHLSWWARLGRRSAPVLPELNNDLACPLLLAARDPAEADSAVLARLAGAHDDGAFTGTATGTATGTTTGSAAGLGRALVVRHRLLLAGPVALEGVRAPAAEEGYRVRVEQQAGVAADRQLVLLWRVERPSALTLSQERSRMAGLAARLGGNVDGYDLCDLS